MLLKQVFILLVCVSCHFVLAQDYYNPNFIRNENYVYDENIKSAQLYRLGWEMSEPFLFLQDTGKLVLEFDDLSENVRQFYYSVAHCDANWEASDLEFFDYAQGFQINNIENKDFSFSTFKNYTHYKLEIPNENFSLTRSGNYILKIFYDFKLEETVVLTKRFFVVENNVTITHNFKRSSLPELMYSSQEVLVNIGYFGYPIPNPVEGTHLVILQNGRWDNALFIDKAVFYKNYEIVYNDPQLNNFWAGNEYRYFNSSSLDYLSDRVKKIYYKDGYEHVVLFTDKSKANKAYVSEPDINGKYVINTNHGEDPCTEADYVFVHFSLEADLKNEPGSIYILGGFNDWVPKKEFRMSLNEQGNNFEAALLLKQGFYNYQYIFISDFGIEKELYSIEGSYYQTENKYTILFYHRPLGGLADELVGIGFVN